MRWRNDAMNKRNAVFRLRIASLRTRIAAKDVFSRAFLTRITPLSKTKCSRI